MVAMHKKDRQWEEIRAQDVQMLYNENGDFSGRRACNENVPEDQTNLYLHPDGEMETEFDTQTTQTYNNILHEENDVERCM